MKKNFALALCLMGTLSLFAETPVIDWSKINWLPCRNEAIQYQNQYKMATAEGQTAVEIRIEQGTAGIYTSFMSAINTCSVDAEIEGAGALLHLDAFTEQVTEVTVACAQQSYTFHVYYSQGTTTDLEEKPSTLNMPNSSKFIQNGRLMIQTPQGTFSVLGQIK